MQICRRSQVFFKCFFLVVCGVMNFSFDLFTASHHLLYLWLVIVDISEPEKPNLLWFRHDKKELEDAQTVLPFEQHLLSGTRDFFSINISNPEAPVFVSKVASRSEGKIDRINGMVRRGNYVFAANKAGWIDVFDVTDINSPRLFGALNVRKKYGIFSPHDVDMYGEYVVIVSPNKFGRNPTGELALFKVFDGDNEHLIPFQKWKLEGLVKAKELRGTNRAQVSGSFVFTGGSFSPTVKKDEGGSYVNQRMWTVDLSKRRGRKAQPLYVQRPREFCVHEYFTRQGEVGFQYEVEREGQIEYYNCFIRPDGTWIRQFLLPGLHDRCRQYLTGLYKVNCVRLFKSNRKN
jgi:hypothetical protein